jgi:hypothetical protein
VANARPEEVVARAAPHVEAGMMTSGNATDTMIATVVAVIAAIAIVLAVLMIVSAIQRTVNVKTSVPAVTPHLAMPTESAKTMLTLNALTASLARVSKWSNAHTNDRVADL